MKRKKIIAKFLLLSLIFNMNGFFNKTQAMISEEELEKIQHHINEPQWWINAEMREKNKDILRKAFLDNKEKCYKSHDEFIEYFNNILYNKEIPYDDNESNSYILESHQIDHKLIKSGIDNCENPELAKSVYAELMWLDYMKISIEKNTQKNYEYNNNFSSIVKIMKLLLRYNVKRHYLNPNEGFFGFQETYSDFLTLLNPPGEDYFTNYISFIEFLYSKNLGYAWKFENILSTLGNQIGVLNKTHSNRKYQIALECFDLVDEKLQKMSSIKDDPSICIIAKAMRELLFKPIKEFVKNKASDYSEKVKEDRSFKILENERYVPYNKSAGSGAFGTVEVYKDIEKNEKVAIKISKFGENFKQIEKLKTIDSPYIAKIYGVINLNNDKQGLVMEYVHGHTSISKALYNVKRFSKTDVLKVCNQLVDGFEEFANAGFIHTDLDQHTENVTLDKTKNIKIIDYDTAFYAGINDKTTRTNIKNALKYIAIALHVSYPDLCEKLFKQFPYMSYDKGGKLFWDPIGSIIFRDKLPTTFKELRDMLSWLSSNLS